MLSGGFCDRSNSRSDWTCTRSFVSKQCLVQSHSTFFSVRSQTDTATAARRCTKLCHDLGRPVHTSMSRWALVLLRHNRCFQVLRPAVPRNSSHFLQLTDHESLFKWHAVQRSRFLDTTFRVNDVFVCHWRLANPDSMAPSLIQICLLARMCTCTALFLRMGILGSCTLSQKHAQTQFSRRFSLESSSGTMLRVESTTLQDAVAW